MKFKITLFWVLATIITISAAIYQRKTGPTYPKNIKIKTEQGIVKSELIRSHGGESDCPIVYTIPEESVTAELSYRRYPTNEEWTTTPMKREGTELKGSLPYQPPAGKVEYNVNFYQNEKLLNIEHEFHTVVRFKGDVPDWILIPHIFFIFFAMLLSNFTAILAMSKHEKTMFYAKLTIAFLFLGGLAFGPVVQLYAFGDLWTGVPFGWDLTDNKTLIAFLAWFAAVVINNKKKKIRYDMIIAAAIIMLLIFAIPHSMFGSELNHVTGTVTQG